MSECAGHSSAGPFLFALRLPTGLGGAALRSFGGSFYPTLLSSSLPSPLPSPGGQTHVSPPGRSRRLFLSALPRHLPSKPLDSLILSWLLLPGGTELTCHPFLPKLL